MESPKRQANSSIQQNSELNGENSNAALLPHLETFDKMLKLPVVEAAWHQSQDVYGRVKGKNSIILIIFILNIVKILRTRPLRQHVSDSACASRTVIQVASGRCHKNLLVEHLIKFSINRTQFKRLNYWFEKLN